jgi:O-methyltransferase domain/Dimerisation domain
MKPADDAARAMLELMTGAWATQALRTAAQLHIADHLRDRPKTTAELAALAGADHDSLDRLLSYLASIGVLHSDGDSFRLSQCGQLLRTDVPDSLHAVALLYGGLFYRSFGALDHAVRTGENAFEHVFGRPTFDYLAEHSEAARTFDLAMAAGSSFFASVAEVVDFSHANVVVDVGGSTGDLLAHILTAHHHLRGVLFERPHVLAAARRRLATLGCLDRCELVAGDFMDGIPGGGDVYLLSRILHDWSDEPCRTILDNCRASMPLGARLLVIERPIPADDAASLARSWDIHMMVNTGGRERTLADYRDLLAATGFKLHDRHPLPLDVEVLAATAGPAHARSDGTDWAAGRTRRGTCG